MDSFLDKAKAKVDDLMGKHGDKVSDAVDQHGDRISQGIEQAGDFVDERTGGKYAGHVDKAQDFAQDRVASLGSEPAATETPKAPEATEGNPS